MFCRNCGNQIPDGVGFCPICGNRVNAQAPVTTNTAVATTKKKKNTGAIIAIIAAVVVVVAIAIILIAIFASGSGAGASSAREVVENLLIASIDLDIDAKYDCFDRDMLKLALLSTGEYSGNIDNIIDDQINKEKQNVANDKTKPYIVDYSINDIEYIVGDEFTELNNTLASKYGNDGKVAAAAYVRFEITTTSNLSKNQSVLVVQIDEKWYVHPIAFYDPSLFIL